ncbi:MAG TPA: MFS transporter, partial [Spongiibacteraceae bacterium]|nr:MFS transporter [Spongiibacteraceae bacterium]
MLTLLLLGFSAGLPYLLVFSTLTAWLRDYEVSRSLIGFFGWVGITYSVKVLWAPVVDRLRLPLLSRLGQRRGWILLGQLTIAAGLAVMAMLDPRESLTVLAMLAVLVAFGSATQDIAIDAYRIEIAERDMQGALAASYLLGYRIGLLLAGAGALYIAAFWSWPVAYF